MEKGGLVDVSKPNLEPVCKNGKDEGVEEGLPPYEGELPDRVT